MPRYSFLKHAFPREIAGLPPVSAGANIGTTLFLDTEAAAISIDDASTYALYDLPGSARWRKAADARPFDETMAQLSGETMTDCAVITMTPNTMYAAILSRGYSTLHLRMWNVRHVERQVARLTRQIMRRLYPGSVVEPVALVVEKAVREALWPTPACMAEGRATFIRRRREGAVARAFAE